MMTLQEAKGIAVRLAIGDLMGWSQPAEGLEDQYPFNADAFARSLPPVMCNEVLEVVAYVYHNERRPPTLVEADEISDEDLEAAGEVYDRLVKGA